MFQLRSSRKKVRKFRLLSVTRHLSVQQQPRAATSLTTEDAAKFWKITFGVNPKKMEWFGSVMNSRCVFSVTDGIPGSMREMPETGTADISCRFWGE